MRVSFPKCPVVGCDHEIDPRFFIHHGERVIGSCDAHGGSCDAPDNQCSCAPCDLEKVARYDIWSATA